MSRYLLLLCLAAMTFAAIGNPAPPRTGGVLRVPTIARPNRNRRPVNQRDTSTATANSQGSSEDPSAALHCKKEIVSPSSFHWSSPNFGVGDYPNDAFCKLSSASSTPGYATLSFNSLDVLCEGRGDVITFKQPPHIQEVAGKSYCGMMTEANLVTGILPTYSFFAKFRTDHSGTDAGFNVTISNVTTDCHMVINTEDVGNSGIIETPEEPNAGSSKICEWWINAPFGKRIELQIFSNSVMPDCSDGSLLADTRGSKYYRKGSSISYCGNTQIETIMSVKNYMSVLFFSTKSADYLSARWSLVDRF